MHALDVLVNIQRLVSLPVRIQSERLVDCDLPSQERRLARLFRRRREPFNGVVIHPSSVRRHSGFVLLRSRLDLPPKRARVALQFIRNLTRVRSLRFRHVFNRLVPQRSRDDDIHFLARFVRLYKALRRVEHRRRVRTARHERRAHFVQQRLGGGIRDVRRRRDRFRRDRCVIRATRWRGCRCRR